MLEGGNQQLSQFFSRHKMGNTDPITLIDRYKTKAASFYRQHLRNHAKEIAEGGLYQGREASRKSSSQKGKGKDSSRVVSRTSSRQLKEQQKQRAMLPTVQETMTDISSSQEDHKTDVNSKDADVVSCIDSLLTIKA